MRKGEGESESKERERKKEERREKREGMNLMVNKAGKRGGCVGRGGGGVKEEESGEGEGVYRSRGGSRG